MVQRVLAKHEPVFVDLNAAGFRFEICRTTAYSNVKPNRDYHASLLTNVRTNKCLPEARKIRHNFAANAVGGKCHAASCDLETKPLPRVSATPPQPCLPPFGKFRHMQVESSSRPTLPLLTVALRSKPLLVDRNSCPKQRKPSGLK